MHPSGHDERVRQGSRCRAQAVAAAAQSGPNNGVDTCARSARVEFGPLDPSEEIGSDETQRPG
eukprot:scaffold34231_cov76-Phaeocystis_antarctica.AAC.2